MNGNKHMHNSIKYMESIEKIGSLRMRSIYRAQKHAGENFLPLMALAAKAATDATPNKEDEHVA